MSIIINAIKSANTTTATTQYAVINGRFWSLWANNITVDLTDLTKGEVFEELHNMVCVVPHNRGGFEHLTKRCYIHEDVVNTHWPMYKDRNDFSVGYNGHSIRLTRKEGDKVLRVAQYYK